MTTFNSEVWQLLKKIPKGKVTTYGKIAIALQKPHAARAVGNACNRNHNAPIIPCHRVVKGTGELGGYANGKQQKIKLLELEGLQIKNNRILDFEDKLFKF